jgi:hypothetical protein
MGIEPEEFLALEAAQQGLCALCGKPEVRMRNGALCRLSLDHCHRTGRVRKLLCMNCNMLLGKVEALGVDKLVSYLAEFSAES